MSIVVRPAAAADIDEAYLWYERRQTGRKTKAGDSFSDTWALEPGAERGTWKMVGATGVFAGKTWSGWWQGVFDEGKATLGVWGGSCN